MTTILYHTVISLPPDDSNAARTERRVHEVPAVPARRRHHAQEAQRKVQVRPAHSGRRIPKARRRPVLGLFPARAFHERLHQRKGAGGYRHFQVSGLQRQSK